MAPAYGEVDFAALQAAGLDVLIDPVDAEGRFTDAIPPLAGTRVKDADQDLIERLKVSGLLYRRDQVRHSYPYCYRTGTPLIYKAIPTWFVRVESFRDRMVEANDRIHWVPEHVGARRFGNWLEDARDWAISRNRYWGSCIPVWQCDRGGHQVCVGSIDELAELSRVRLEDLHREHVDPVTFACADCAGTMRRVPEVLDCWFESGSMPYGQLHYPFENRERFERAFPAHFIAEGLDQTRGWFYTLLVLSTAIFDTEPFRNCVVNGLILAEDGRKMSKSLKNYPDPNGIFDEFGADALRAYLINSPVLRAEPFRFSRDGVREVVRTVLLPLWNAFSFFTTYAEADGISTTDLASAPAAQDRPELDRWVLSVLQSLVAEVNRQMEGYYLYAVIPPVLGFIDDLTNWYVRRARRRFWRSRGEDEADKLAAFATMHEVLVTFATVLAPVLPFVTEEIHQALVVIPSANGSPPASIHHADYPVADAALIDVDLELAMESVRAVTRLSHALRKQHGVKVRQPLRSVTVLTRSSEVEQAVLSHVELIKDEVNVREVLVRHDESSLVDLSVRPDYRTLGPKLGARVREVAAGLGAISGADVERLQHGERLTIAGVEVGIDDVVVQRMPRPGTVVASESELSVALDMDLDQDLLSEGLAREVVSRVQQLRRDAGLDVATRIRLSLSTPNPELRERNRVAPRASSPAKCWQWRRRRMARPTPKTEVNGAPLSVGIEAVADADRRALQPPSRSHGRDRPPPPHTARLSSTAHERVFVVEFNLGLGRIGQRDGWFRDLFRSGRQRHPPVPAPRPGRAPGSRPDPERAPRRFPAPCISIAASSSAGEWGHLTVEFGGELGEPAAEIQHAGPHTSEVFIEPLALLDLILGQRLRIALGILHDPLRFDAGLATTVCARRRASTRASVTASRSSRSRPTSASIAAARPSAARALPSYSVSEATTSSRKSSTSPWS